MRHTPRFTILLGLFATTLPGWSQPAQVIADAPEQPPELTLALAMSDPDWIGNAPENPYWADDGRSVYYSQKRPGEEVRDLVQLELGSQTSRIVPVAELGRADAAQGEFSQDRQLKVFEREGDLFLKDLATGTLRQLTRTAARETDPFFLAAGRRITFRRGDELLLRELDSGLEAQLAELKLEKDPLEKEREKPYDYLALQQERLIGFVRQGREKREAARDREIAARRADPTRLPPPYYLGEGVEIRELSLSPNGRHLLVVLGKKDENQGKADQMPNYVTASAYVESREVRPKVGTGESAPEKLVWIDLELHEQTELALGALPGITDDPLKELREKAEAARKTKKEEASTAVESEDLPVEELPLPVALPTVEAGADALAASVVAVGEPVAPVAEPAPPTPAPDAKPRAVTFRQLVWNQSGSRVAIAAFSDDNKDRWIATVDPEKKTLVPVHHLEDEAWVGWDFDELGWLPGAESLWYLSEESGFGHLYLADLTPLAAGGEIGRRQLTAGEFSVANVVANRDGSAFTFQANRDHPGLYEIFRVELGSGEIRQLTRLGGMNTGFEVSPDESRLLVLHSTTTEPPELYLQANEPDATATRLTQTVSSQFAAIRWMAPEIVAVPSSHTSRPIYSRLYLPSSEMSQPADEPAEPRPAVFFIHGAGYLQNAHQGWSTYFREFMFHNLLARRGYVVLDMDYRASQGYGRDWRTAIYRRMGTPELEDLADGIDYVVANHGVDRKRIGVYGGSYGGFLTMMALFKRPELFAAGAALRPVTDWAHYNHPYTSSILNTPTIDPEAYEQSSPIEFADGLEKPLLICAPMQDDNVFFQDTVRLAQKLIELGKENWEVAIYPVEPHGFRVPSSWLDEYRRILKLMETHLNPR